MHNAPACSSQGLLKNVLITQALRRPHMHPGTNTVSRQHHCCELCEAPYLDGSSQPEVDARGHENPWPLLFLEGIRLVSLQAPAQLDRQEVEGGLAACCLAGCSAMAFVMTRSGSSSFSMYHFMPGGNLASMKLMLRYWRSCSAKAANSSGVLGQWFVQRMCFIL